MGAMINSHDGKNKPAMHGGSATARKAAI